MKNVKRSYRLALLLAIVVATSSVWAGTTTSSEAATVSKEHQEWVDVKGTVVPLTNSYLLIDWATKTAIQVPSSAIKRENAAFKIRTGITGNCVALAAGPENRSFAGDGLSKDLSGDKTTVDGVKIFRDADCTCNRGDKCCCPDGWTCCNGGGRCCCHN